MFKIFILKKKNFIIAIDGHSSTGKSTLAKQLAEKLNFLYIDTGAMYRAVTWYAIKNGLLSPDYFDKDALIDKLEDLHIEFKKNKKPVMPMSISMEKTLKNS